jgi:hypothetical protein
MAGELMPELLVDILAEGQWIGIPGEVRRDMPPYLKKC